MVVCERLRRCDDLVQVGVHELGDEVDVLEAVERCLPQDVLDPYDVLMVEVTQDLDLSQCTLRVCQVLERLVDLLDGDLLAGGVVNRLVEGRDGMRTASARAGAVAVRARARRAGRTEQTTPYAPWPMGLTSVYRASTSKRVPQTMNELMRPASSPAAALASPAAAEGPPTSMAVDMLFVATFLSFRPVVARRPHPVTAPRVPNSCETCHSGSGHCTGQSR